MVAGGLFISATVGVILTAAFLYFEVGRYAEPQVPRTLFDERKSLLAYTAGLFVGAALSIPYGLLLTSLPAGFLVAAVIGLLILVAGIEIGQILLLRTVFFGRGDARPFYVVTFRGGIAAILCIIVVSLAFGNPSLDGLGLAASLVTGVAVVLLLEAGAVLSVPRTEAGAPAGGPMSSALYTGLGFLFMGFGSLLGEGVEAVVAIVVALTAARSYFGLRERTLGSVRPPPAPSDEEEAPVRPKFGRTDR